MSYLEKYIRIGINNIGVSYTDEGKNEVPAIIFIHGFPFNKSIVE